MKISRIFATLLLLGSIAFIVMQQPRDTQPSPASQPSAAAQQPSSSGHRLAESLQRKLDHIQQNAQLPRPDPAPTVMTEEEINDYIASGHITLPQGVKKLTLQGRSGVITAFANIDFDEIRAGQHSSNPLLSLFSGRHDVRVEANADASDGEGHVHIRSVNIDTFEVPRMALEFFVSKYIAPKYPNVGLDSQFKLRDKVDTATVGYHKLTVTQR
jgi:hypothetical protein